MKMIVDVATDIKLFYQFIIFTLENEETVKVTIEELQKLVSLSIAEVDVLVGSYVDLDNKNELKGIHHNNDNISDYRTANSHKIIDFEQIEHVEEIIKYEKKRVLLITEKNTIEIDKNSLTVKVGLSDKHFILEGCYIKPEFFQPGEMAGNFPVHHENKTVKELNLRLPAFFRQKNKSILEMYS